MKKSYYFPHDYNSSNDIKCLFLRQSLGMEGYGIFWFLVEQLANAGGKLPIKIIPVMAMQMQVTETKVHAVITKFDLFQLDENNFFCSVRLNYHLNIRKTLSEKGKQGALNRWGNGEANGGAIRDSIGEGNAKEKKEKKVNEIKEIKEKEIKEIIETEFLSFDVILSEFQKQGLLKRPFLDRMSEIYSLDLGVTKEMFRKWSIKNEGIAMTIRHAENSFNLYLKNNKPEKNSAQVATSGKSVKNNVFTDLLNNLNEETQ